MLGPFDDGYRGRRIDFLLRTDDSVTVEDMKRYQADSLEVRAQEIVPYVVSAWQRAGDGNSTVNQAVQWLSNWDFVMDPDEIAPTLWPHLLQAIGERTFDELAGLDVPLSRVPILERLIKENNSYYFDDHRTPEIETRDDIMVVALHDALDEMVKEHGHDTANWVYGAHHVIRIGHIAGLTYIGGGPHRGQDTLNAAHGWTVRSGPSWRMVADLGDIGRSFGVYPGGQSGNIVRKHWDDLFWLWYTFDEESETYDYHMMYFYASPEEFAAADTTGTMIERELVFVP